MWKWVKVPKGIALLAFLLPWMTVSCAGQNGARIELASANGFGLAFGSFTSPAGGSPFAGTPAAETNLWLVAAIVLVAAGLAASFARPARGATLAVLVTSAASIVLIWAGTMRYGKTTLIAEASRRSNEPMDPAAAALLVEWHWGFWLALAALAAAAGMALLVLNGRDGAVAASIRDRLAGAAPPPGGTGPPA